MITLNTLPENVWKVLESHPDVEYTAKELATKVVEDDTGQYQFKQQKQADPNDRDSLITQLSAEIGSVKDGICKRKNIYVRDEPRPRIFWHSIQITPVQSSENSIPKVASSIDKSFSEKELYPILIHYLHSKLKLYCRRIEETVSSNMRGLGGNQWLHPDIVAMEPVGRLWNPVVKTGIKESMMGQRVRYWSFEVKKDLTISNVRNCFFQAVSNSSWANEGYLVAISISDDAKSELRMLSEVHGIGLILLDPKSPDNSNIILPARPRLDVAWSSVNRIVVVNKDFKNYIELTNVYLKTGDLSSSQWNK